MITKGMTANQIVEVAATRGEIVWGWSCQIINNNEIKKVAEELELSLLFGEPIFPGDLYLAIRNTGPKLLTCAFLGEACVHAEENAYAFDFSECVKVVA